MTKDKDDEMSDDQFAVSAGLSRGRKQRVGSCGQSSGLSCLVCPFGGGFAADEGQGCCCGMRVSSWSRLVMIGR